MDAVNDVRSALREILSSSGIRDLVSDVNLGPDVHWSPHLFDPKNRRGWYCLAEVPESDSWFKRMVRAQAAKTALQLGVAGPFHVLQHASVLNACDNLGAALAVTNSDTLLREQVVPTAGDFVYQGKLRLETKLAGEILDR